MNRTAAHAMTPGENAPTLARAAAGQLRLDVALGEGHLRRHAVHDAAHTFAVGLAVRGHAEVLAPGRHRGGKEEGEAGVKGGCKAGEQCDAAVT